MINILSIAHVKPNIAFDKSISWFMVIRGSKTHCSLLEVNFSTLIGGKNIILSCLIIVMHLSFSSFVSISKLPLFNLDCSSQKVGISVDEVLECSLLSEDYVVDIVWPVLLLLVFNEFTHILVLNQLIKVIWLYEFV